MRVYKHQSGHRVAVTADQEGASLPADAVWTPLGSTDVQAGKPRIGKSGDEILADIEKKGYSVIPDDNA